MARSDSVVKHQQPDLQTAKRCFQHRTVRKKFGSHGYFEGKVTEVWKDKRGLTFAHVEYTDGDEEDLELKELKGILVDEKGNEGGKKRSSASSSSFGSLLKKVKGKGDGGGKKDKGKDRDKKSSKRGAEASSSSSLAKRLLKTKRGKGADLEEQDDLLSLSVTGSEHDAAQGRGKASGGGGGDKGKQATAAAGGKARKSDAYHSGLKALIAAGELQAGEGCVCVCRGQDVVTAELLPREDGCYQGAVYASAENLAAHVFGCKKEPAIAGPEQNGEAAAAAEVKEECAATAAAVAAAAAMDVGGGADGAGGAAGEVKGEGEAVIRIEMGGKPVEHWEECMAPIRGGAGQQGTDGGGKAEKEGPDMEAAQGWLRQMEKAVFVLEAVLRDEGAMASIKGGGAGAKGTASEEGARRLANLVHLKVALRKLQSGLRGDGEEEDGPLPQPQEEEEEEGEGEEEKVKGERGGEGAASSSLAAAADSAPVASAAGTHPPPLGKQFSAEVLRLHWLPWLHAEIEQMLRGLPTGGKAALDLQAELAKSLGAVAAAADDEGPAGKTGGEEEEEEGEKAAAAEDAGSAGPGQRQITQIADYRWQLKHMVPEARDVLLEKLQVERAQLKAALTAYNRQARILEAVQTQEEEARRRRREAGRELAAAVAAGEAEEKRLLARLEAVRGRLAAARGQLARVEAQAVEVRLLLRKTQQWKGKVVDTNRVYHSVQERITVLEALDRYMEGLFSSELEGPLVERLQHHLGRLSNWCCQAAAPATEDGGPLSQDKKLLARCRVRLAFELFSLVQRLWGEVAVRVADMRKLRGAFQNAYLHHEHSPVPCWEGLPLHFPDAAAPLWEQQEAAVAVLRRTAGAGGDGGEACFLLAEGAVEEGAVTFNTAYVQEALGFQTVIVAPSPAAAAEGSNGRLLNVVRAAATEAAEAAAAAGSSKKEQEEGDKDDEEGVEYRPLRCLLLPPGSGPPTSSPPPFLCDCLVLVHSQDYLCRVARLSSFSAASASLQDSETPAAAASAAVATADPSTQAASPAPMEVEEESPSPTAEIAPNEKANAAAQGSGKGKGKATTTSSSSSGGAAGAGGIVVPWWEEVVHGAVSTRVAPGAFAAAMQAAVRVCKAVDLVMLANPAEVTQAVLDGGAEVARGQEQHRATNAACLVPCAGHAAGRYGSLPAQEAEAAAGSVGLVNLAAVALMHARVAWGVRRVCVVDLDVTRYGQGTDEVLKGDSFSLYASVHVKSPGVPKDLATATRVLCTLPSNSNSGSGGSGSPAVRAAFRRHVSRSVVPALEAGEAKLVLLSLPSDGQALRAAGLEAADVEWAAREIDAATRRVCAGRVVSIVEAPVAVNEEEGEEGAKLLAAQLRGLARWSKQQAASSSQEEGDDDGGGGGGRGRG